MRALAVGDRLVGTGRHEVVGRLHLPDGQARWCEPDAAMIARARRVQEGPEAFEARAVELGPAEAPVGWVLLERGLETSLVPSRYSPGYGRVVPAVSVEFRRQLSPPARLGWVFVFR